MYYIAKGLWLWKWNIDTTKNNLKLARKAANVLAQR